MSSIHVCVVYSVRTHDSVVMGVGSILLPVYAVYYEFSMVYEAYPQSGEACTECNEGEPP